jgi:hypothetical protein
MTRLDIGISLLFKGLSPPESVMVMRELVAQLHRDDLQVQQRSTGIMCSDQTSSTALGHQYV